MRYLIGLLALVLVACASQPALDANTPPLVLTGEITRADHQTYREIPFTPPPGTGRITIDFAYTGKDQKTVIDIGLRDPDGQRGWSGGNKSHIEIGENGATPSYRPGRIQSGEWKLVLGIPNIRSGLTATYTATIRFARADAKPKEIATKAVGGTLNTKPDWYRGDFHMHTAHSDGSCEVGGQRQPCPVVNTANAARDAGLDFVAITDHNTITQLTDMRRLQKDYPTTLLIPGTEVTTFFGHANVIGNSDFVDFQLGSDRLPALGKLFDEASAQGAIISINHPGLPSGEICMGCGWTAKDTDWSRVTALEVINGSTLRTAGADAGTQGIKLWDSLLKQGYRITAIGGSDNHDATDRAGAKQPPVGAPATLVFAGDLSAKSIIAGVKSGNVYIDAAGFPDMAMSMKVLGPKPDIDMGGTLTSYTGKSEVLNIVIDKAPAGARLFLTADGVVIEESTLINPPSSAPDTMLYVVGCRIAPGAAHGYIRAEVRDASGKLLLLGNPIYFVRAPAP